MIKQIVEEAVQGATGYIEPISKTFLDPQYDMNTVIENEADFILGAVLSQIVNNINTNLIEIDVNLRQKEFNQIHQFVFSQSPTLKENIKKFIGL